ncbi:response regulator [Alcanivorax sp. JB21]|uniref:response regulator n=1 Tax=Alcanivorax limicola TaxID=2874102 RepID=UPI001CBE717D|nr:response regulator [Alcanivorax limicola]MBZ2188961.1 response regulator [Alcanivorax limicola]
MNSKPILLFVDDEERILRTLVMAFRSRYRVLSASSGEQALALLREHPVDVVISDQRMPHMTGVEVLRQAREIAPRAMRILLTGYAELASIVGSINEGEIFRYVQKPWRLDELRDTIAEAVDIARVAPDTTAAPATAPATGGIMVLDGDPALHQLIRQAHPDLHVELADNLDLALTRMAQQAPAVLVTDLQLPEGDISDALRLLKASQPELVTLVVTAFRDTGHLIRLINQAQVYRVLPRPVSRNMLLRSVESALRHHQLLQNRPALMRRHTVEATPVAADNDVGRRVRGYLDRLRGRTTPA